MFSFIDNDTNKKISKKIDIKTIEEIYYQTITPENITKKLKEEISKIEDKIPLYDIYSENIYLITKENVYNRVKKEYYRLPDKELLDNIKKSKPDNNDPLKERILRKKKLMLKFMEIYDLDILKDTYVKVFYNYSTDVGKNLSTCKRPSFNRLLRHVNPYYTRSEIINIALNMGLIESSNIYYDKEKVNKLCKIVVENDINSNIILEHNNYLLKTKKIGLIQYYSLQGSYFINNYLRGFSGYNSKNDYMEEIIDATLQTVRSAPAFDKDYIVYRFIEDTHYLDNLEVGDIFIDKGFTSTTRDPFYNSDEFKFGFNLIKIKLPKNKKGIGLCIESVSHFPEEQEIILPPGTKLKLLSRDSNCLFYHTSYTFGSQIVKKFEFEIVGYEKIKINRESRFTPQIISFIDLERKSKLTLNNQFNYFVDMYCGEQFRFKSKIGKQLINISVERYDSTSVYNKFYYKVVQNGYSINAIYKNIVLFSLELSELGMFVNYYLRYTYSDREFLKDYGITDYDLAIFFSEVAYYFNIKNIIFFADYYNNSYNIGTYSYDFYKYLKSGIKRFEEYSDKIVPVFSYYSLDRMKEISMEKVLKKTDPDEIYQLYKIVYNGENNFKDFYLWIAENYSNLTKQLVHKTVRVFRDHNPFEYDFYLINPNNLLKSHYKNYFIEYLEIPVFDDDIQPKNRYRIDDNMIRYTNRIVQ